LSRRISYDLERRTGRRRFGCLCASPARRGHGAHVIVTEDHALLTAARRSKRAQKGQRGQTSPAG
jgi:hypothetical protein